MSLRNDPDGNAADREFTITRVFDAPRELVFKAWTEAAHLARWFGPKGCTIRVAKLELRSGGIFHFAMKTPDGHETWGKWIFREVVPPGRIVLASSFSDAEGGVTRHPGSPSWPLETLSTTTLEEEGGKTKLTLRWAPINPTAAERRTFDDGLPSMTMGWTGTFDQLESYLTGLANP